MFNLFRKKIILTSDDLKKFNICYPQLKRFKFLFPNGLEVSEKGFLEILNSYDCSEKFEAELTAIEGWHLCFFFGNILNIMLDEQKNKAYKLKVMSKEHKEFFINFFKKNRKKIEKAIIKIRKK